MVVGIIYNLDIILQTAELRCFYCTAVQNSHYNRNLSGTLQGTATSSSSFLTEF